MDPDVLTATVARYNDFCAKSEVEDFGKKPENLMPFGEGPCYAFAVRNFDNGASRVDISINEDFQVLRPDGTVIPGIYCAGDAATYSWTENVGPVGLCDGLAGSWASGYHMADLVKGFLSDFE